MKASPEVESEIVAALNTFSDLVSRKQKAAVFELFAADADVVSIGCEARETAGGPEEIKTSLREYFQDPTHSRGNGTG
ncbi:MAG: nuclear transport factor 2 family protein [Nitrososphaerota archaeon]|nr:nuclear transport factor 2 family protein [Nitrososphaerota archaeon]